MEGVQPESVPGLRQLSLSVLRFEECVIFYSKLLGMVVESQPDVDTVFLCSCGDRLLLNRHAGGVRELDLQRLQHIGFMLEERAEVDRWYEFLRLNGVRMKNEAGELSDGAYSFSCLDPDGNTLQFLHLPVMARE